MQAMKNKKRRGQVVCGFPAVGKTSFLALAASRGYNATDSDSEKHHWVDQNVPRAERVERVNWVELYVDHLVEEAKTNDIVFCSTHQEVRDELVRRGIGFTVVYPTADQKEKYLARVGGRTTGLCGEFGIKLMTESWDAWMDGMVGQKHCRHVVLRPGQYLADVIDQVLSSADDA